MTFDSSSQILFCLQGFVVNADPPTQIQLEDIPCPLCGSDEHSLRLESRDLLHEVPGSYRIVRCCHCRHLYMTPRPTLKTLPLCYPDGYGPHEPVVTTGPDSSITALPTSDESSPATSNALPTAVESSQQPSDQSPWYLSGVVRSIPGLRSFYHWLTDSRSEFLPSPESDNARAIELGCATGKFLLRLQDAGWKAEGIELVESAAEESRSLGFHVHAGTLESASVESNTYDGAFAWHVLEHLPDPRASLIEFHRVLNNDGWLAFSIPNVSCWEPVVFGRMWYLWEIPRHLHFFGPSRIRQLLIETGFNEIRIIHQRTLLNVVGSLALCLKQRWPHSSLTEKLLDYPNHPRMWWQILLAPAAIFLATMRQGGRLTVIARCHKPLAKPLTQNEEQSSESA